MVVAQLGVGKSQIMAQFVDDNFANPVRQFSLAGAGGDNVASIYGNLAGSTGAIDPSI